MSVCLAFVLFGVLCRNKNLLLYYTNFKVHYNNFLAFLKILLGFPSLTPKLVQHVCLFCLAFVLFSVLY